MSYRSKTIFILIISASAFTGCASIMSGTKQAVSFDSNPSGAVVSIDGQTLGKTPVTVVIKRHSKQKITLEKTGFEPINLPLNTNLNSWFWGNLVSWNLPGWIVDAISGSMTEYSPNYYLVNLQSRVASGDSQSKEQKEPVVIDDKKKVESFVLMNNIEIRKDIVKGNGTYLSTLLTLLKTDSQQRPERINEIKQLAEKTEDPTSFAQFIVEKFVK